jgi:hypothetical protein
MNQVNNINNKNIPVTSQRYTIHRPGEIMQLRTHLPTPLRLALQPTKI